MNERAAPRHMALLALAVPIPGLPFASLAQLFANWARLQLAGKKLDGESSLTGGQLLSERLLIESLCQGRAKREGLLE
jgi:hypothetical protein